MSKAMLITDMPETCYEWQFLDEADNCLAMDVYYTDVEVVIEKPTWCPLKEVPHKKEVPDSLYLHSEYFDLGYNACLDEILGGGEWWNGFYDYYVCMNGKNKNLYVDM